MTSTKLKIIGITSQAHELQREAKRTQSEGPLLWTSEKRRMERRIEQLEKLVETLEYKLEEAGFVDTQKAKSILPHALNMTSQQARVLIALCKHKHLSKDGVYLALAGSTYDYQAFPKIIDTQICKMRAKLKKFEIKIETVWGEGYRIDDENILKIKALKMLENDNVSKDSD